MPIGSGPNSHSSQHSLIATLTATALQKLIVLNLLSCRFMADVGGPYEFENNEYEFAKLDGTQLTTQYVQRPGKLSRRKREKLNLLGRIGTGGWS